MSLLVVVLLRLASAIDTTKWHGRTIYFVVTDRFATTTSPKSRWCVGRDWCGGTLRGVIEQLDYIESMGFDALWITPVVKQVPWRDNYNGTGYHGYWALDFYQVEPRIGTEDDLLVLSAECHARGMLLMLDVVANHVGPLHTPEQIARLGPGINDASNAAPQFHQLRRQPGESLASFLHNHTTMMQAGRCYPTYDLAPGVCNYTVLLDGWFGDLGDLRQEHPPTRSYLLRWVRHMVSRYKLDGLRLDTVLYMPKAFLAEFQQAAGVLILGEVSMSNWTLHRSFVPSVSSLLNFPLTGSLASLFSTGGDLRGLRTLLQTQATLDYPLGGALLGTFVDNHDSPRFLFSHMAEGAAMGLAQLRNALAFVLLWQGLPILYYGTEQIAVSNASHNRASMWGTGYGHTELVAFISELHQLRRRHGLAHRGENVTLAGRVVAASADTLIFERGSLRMMVNNIGKEPSWSSRTQLL